MKNLVVVGFISLCFAFAIPIGFQIWQTITEDDVCQGMQVHYNYALYLDNDAIQFQNENALEFKLNLTPSSNYQNEGVALGVSNFYVSEQTEVTPLNYTLKLVSVNSGGLKNETSIENSYSILENTPPNPIKQVYKDITYIIEDKDGKKKGKVIVRISTSKKLLD